MWKDFLIFGLLISISVSGTKTDRKEHDVDKKQSEEEEFNEDPEDKLAFNLLKRHLEDDETEYNKRPQETDVYARAVNYDEHEYDQEGLQESGRRDDYSEENDNKEGGESSNHHENDRSINENHPNKKEPASHKTEGENQKIVKEITANQIGQQIQPAANVVIDQASINKSLILTNPAVPQAQPATNSVTYQSSTPLPNNINIVASVVPNNQLPLASVVASPNALQNQVVKNPLTNQIAQPSTPVPAHINNVVPNTASTAGQVVAGGLKSRSSFPINDTRSLLKNQNLGKLSAYDQLPINNIAAKGPILLNEIKSPASLPLNITPNDLSRSPNLEGLQYINTQLPGNFPPNNIAANRNFPQYNRLVALENQNVNSPFKIFQQIAKNSDFQPRAIESLINNQSQDKVSSPMRNYTQNNAQTNAKSGNEGKVPVPNNQMLKNVSNLTLQLLPKNGINNGSADVSTQRINSETPDRIPSNHGFLSIKDVQFINPSGNQNQPHEILMNNPSNIAPREQLLQESIKSRGIVPLGGINSNIPYAFQNQLGAGNQLPHIFGVRQLDPNQFMNADQQFLNNLYFTNHPLLPARYNNMASRGLADLGSQLEKNFVENPKSIASVGQFIQDNIPKNHYTDQPGYNVVKVAAKAINGVDGLLEDRLSAQKENARKQTSSLPSSENKNQNSMEEEDIADIMGLKKKKTKKIPLGLNIYATIHKNSQKPKETKLLEAPIDLTAGSRGFLFAVHGVNKMENYVSNFFSKIAKVFTALNFTVVTVNWTLCTKTELSPKDENHNIKEAALTGNFLGKYINKLNTTSLLYVIGDDLGTVAAAHVAYNVKNPLDFIFGTNERYFKQHKYNGMYLRQDMAKLVQVIHSNETFFAYAARDFYPNKKLLKKKTTYDLLLEDAKSLGKTYSATLCYSRTAYKDKKCKENPVSSMFNTTVPKDSVGKYFV